jgi:lipooligosaccharide transport system permease protein
MFLFSGTFFPITVLPPSIQLLGQVLLPLTHSVNIARGLTLGTPDISMITSLIWLAVATLIFFVLAINSMARKLIK